MAFDLHAYLARVGLDEAPPPTAVGVRALCLAQLRAVPFENLDPMLGRPVALDPEALQDKLVDRRRGGYCFEANGLMRLVLQALGAAVTPLAGRVVFGRAADGPPPPLSHMTLKVDLPEGPHLVDVGFGGQSPGLVRLIDDEAQVQAHGTYRVIAVGGARELQMHTPEGWGGLYRFTEEPQGALDYEVFNWFCCTHPKSRFTNNLIASRLAGDARVTLINRERSVQGADGTVLQRRLLDCPGDLVACLNEDFGIVAEAADIDALFARLPAPG